MLAFWDMQINNSLKRYEEYLGVRVEVERFPALDHQKFEKQVGRSKKNKAAGADQLLGKLL